MRDSRRTTTTSTNPTFLSPLHPFPSLITSIHRPTLSLLPLHPLSASRVHSRWPGLLLLTLRRGWSSNTTRTSYPADSSISREILVLWPLLYTVLGCWIFGYLDIYPGDNLRLSLASFPGLKNPHLPVTTQVVKVVFLGFVGERSSVKELEYCRWFDTAWSAKGSGQTTIKGG